MLQGEHGEHSAILSTFIKLPFVIKIFVLSIFEWPFNTGFIVMTVNHLIFAASKVGDFKRLTYWCSLILVVPQVNAYQSYFLFS